MIKRRDKLALAFRTLVGAVGYDKAVVTAVRQPRSVLLRQRKRRLSLVKFHFKLAPAETGRRLILLFVRAKDGLLDGSVRRLDLKFEFRKIAREFKIARPKGIDALFRRVELVARTREPVPVARHKYLAPRRVRRTFDAPPFDRRKFFAFNLSEIRLFGETV